jgi:threonine/homoserine/homoserine lactone efflux protein
MFELLLKVVVISTSGALAPGPLTAAIASAGLKKGWKQTPEVLFYNDAGNQGSGNRIAP